MQSNNKLRQGGLRTSAGRLTVATILALIVPVGLQVLFIAATGGDWWDYDPYGQAFDMLAFGLSIGAGFVLLARAWRWYSLVMAILNVPIMYFILAGVSVGAQCGIHGRCL
jgi:hypothetical protein